ncbi:retrovirus-related Pol polyprotein from transposon TNT 1-94 [Trichonephila clavata]|uniref:Retrovirus-related Pol polyprotein from transposon TNT 1-94 n=1 Tax=Trichonephila clavata TaxID=2740835 RepID=A0A8X6L7H6_TRICU|nr:retrovirus-related Pol polyprotein from transposon TNT 1-94 [Trichonephila clavata]
MKQDLEKAETIYFSNFLSKKKLSKVPRNVNTVPGGATATPADPSGKAEYQKKDGKVFNCKTTKHLKRSIKRIGPCYLCNKYGHLKVNCKEKNSREKPSSTANENHNTEFNINLRFCEAECSIIELNKHLVTSCNLFEENSDKVFG